MAKTKDVTPRVTMEDIFQFMKAMRDEHNVRIGFVCFPVVGDYITADFGFSVQVRNPDGKLIREVTCSQTYWPSEKYTSWEAAVLDCLNCVSRDYEDEYLPLISYLSRQY